jgi:TRAP-type mannitol/chloroaromatic compound transport system substrate-binding protein
MKRREFLSTTAKSSAIAVTAGVMAACGTQLATPAVSPSAPTAAATNAPVQSTVAAPTVIGQAQPSFDWQMATSWPVSLDTIFGGAQIFAERVGAMTGGKFKITPRAAGELAPGTQVLDVVSQGAVPLGHTASYYYVGKSPVTAFGTALPFGFTAQQQNAWLYDGGGLKLLQDFYQKKFGVIQFPAGNTGAQMGGWFRKEINTPEDLKGLKMRIPGLGGQVMTKLGVTVQVLAGGEIFQALQTGAVDAAEWVGPYDDEKLGFYKVAKYYYYPGWWEPGPSLEVEVNLNEWNKLPPEYQEVIKTAAAQANIEMLARYDARNQKALQTLLGQGVELRPYSKEILQAASDAATALFDEFSGKDADFKTIFAEWKAFRDNVRAWNKVNEGSFANFVYGTS